jgi:hypothetical protein
MNIYWENVRWETEEAGAKSATLADNEHNSLTLKQHDGTITFYTNGNPSFDTGAILDITAICMVLSKASLSQAGESATGGARTDEAQAEATNVHVPGPRQEAAQQEDVRRRAEW